jgi:hypothetical protein
MPWGDLIYPSPLANAKRQIFRAEILLEDESAIEEAEFGGIDKPFAANADTIYLAVQIAIPELQKIAKLRETGNKVIVLPDKGLQQFRMVWHVVQDLRGYQAVAFELGYKLLISHEWRLLSIDR